MDKKQTWNFGYWLSALLLLMRLQNVGQGATQIEPVPCSEFEKALAAGRIADELVKATDIARDMVSRCGMDEALGHLAFEPQRAQMLDLPPDVAHVRCSRRKR